MYPYPQMVQRLEELRRAEMLRKANARRLYEEALDKNRPRGLAHLAVRMLRSVHRRHDTPAEGDPKGGARQPALGATHP